MFIEMYQGGSFGVGLFCKLLQNANSQEGTIKTLLMVHRLCSESKGFEPIREQNFIETLPLQWRPDNGC